LGAVAILAVNAGEPAPLMPKDLPRFAAEAGPGAALLRELAVPADELMLSDGTRLRVEPMREYLRPGAAISVPVRTLAEPAKEIKIAGTDVTEVRYYEKQALDGIATLLAGADTSDAAWAAERALRACLRFSQSRREFLGPGDSPWASSQRELADRLVEVRRRLLQLLGERDDLAEALRWGEIWLPLYGAESRLGEAVRALWIRHAQRLLKSDDAPRARAQLERIEETFPQSADAEPLRKELRARAEALVQQARDVPDAKAIVTLQQSLAIWPQLPGLRDELEKRKGTFQVLYVAVRDLPEYLSPALAYSDAEQQALELIFEGLVHRHQDAKLGTSYRPALAETLIAGTGTRRPLVLRRDVAWSDGERFTAADVRHTVELLTKSHSADGAAWRELIETPRLEGNPHRLQLVYHQGLFDPWAPWRVKILPQHAHGKAVVRADDPEFAAHPVGTGPYQLHGKEGAEGRVYLIMRADPYFVRQGVAGPKTVREIRIFAWPASQPEAGQPLPHLMLDVVPGHTAALQKHGYDVRRLAQARVWFLGVNHRRPMLNDVNVRLALAQAIDRRGLLERHFRSGAADVAAQSLNGPFPRGSYANSSSQRVPEELYRPDDAQASARKAGKALPKVEWTLKYPAGDPRLDTAFKELAEQVAKVLAAADMHVTIRPQPLPPRKLQVAVRERDFDLVYEHVDTPDAPGALWPLFDPHADAVGPGGSNYLGYDQDAQLQGLLRSALHHRSFPAVREFMHGIHARLHATMPLIPLWQVPYTVAVHPKLQTDELDALAVFANVAQWKLTP
jgi:ABC-type transport system substrate-binding protein